MWLPSAQRMLRLALYREVDAVLHDEPTDLGTTTCGSMTQEDLLDLLLGRSTGVAAVDCRVDKLVKRYLRKAWRTRKPLTLALNSVLGHEDTLWAYKRTRSAYPFSPGNGLWAQTMETEAFIFPYSSLSGTVPASGSTGGHQRLPRSTFSGSLNFFRLVGAPQQIIEIRGVNFLSYSS